jgi:hypothetical protein
MFIYIVFQTSKNVVRNNESDNHNLQQYERDFHGRENGWYTYLPDYSESDPYAHRVSGRHNYLPKRNERDPWFHEPEYDKNSNTCEPANYPPHHCGKQTTGVMYDANDRQKIYAPLIVAVISAQTSLDSYGQVEIASTPIQEYTHEDIANNIEQFKKWLHKPCKLGDPPVQAYIIRNKGIIGIYPTFKLFFENNVQSTCVLIAKKKVQSRTSYYSISIDKNSSDSHNNVGENVIGKLRGNETSTSVMIYDDGKNPNKNILGIPVSSYRKVMKQYNIILIF